MSLQIHNLGRRVNRKWLIRNLDLNVNPGECLALLGPSGCGKSTTLRLIAGLDKPDEGSIYINDRNVKNISSVDRKIGMVFQSYALFPHLTVLSNLLLGLKVRKVPYIEQKRRVSRVLSLLKLDDYSDQLPSQLSGGQRQRVALARALLRDPDIYLLDEPMSNLDAQLREDLRPELRKLILNGYQPVIYVTHDQNEAMAIADRIAVMKKGYIEQLGTPKELYENPKTLFVASFIGRPQINIFFRDTKIIKCIRPEHIQIADSGIKAKIQYIEWLGENQLVFLNTSNGPIKMLCNSNQKLSETVFLSWPKNKEHHYDATDHNRIE